MAAENPLVDPRSRFNWDQYFPDPGQIQRGDYSSLSPFTSGGDWWAGSGLWNDCKQLAESINKGDLVGEIFGGVTVTLDVLGTVMDPIGTAGSMLASWVIEHLKPLRLLLDELAGNPTTITGVAQTWTNISNRMIDVAQDYRTKVTRQTAGWQGVTADAYRRSAGKLYDAAGAAASLAEAMGGLIKAAGELVATARSFVRDQIAALVAELISDGIQEAASWGAATPAVMVEALGAIFRCSSKTINTIKNVIETLQKIVTIASKVNSMVKAIARAIEDLHNAHTI